MQWVRWRWLSITLSMTRGDWLSLFSVSQKVERQGKPRSHFQLPLTNDPVCTVFYLVVVKVEWDPSKISVSGFFKPGWDLLGETEFLAWGSMLRRKETTIKKLFSWKFCSIEMDFTEISWWLLREQILGNFFAEDLSTCRTPCDFIPVTRLCLPAIDFVQFLVCLISLR